MYVLVRTELGYVSKHSMHVYVSSLFLIVLVSFYLMLGPRARSSERPASGHSSMQLYRAADSFRSQGSLDSTHGSLESSLFVGSLESLPSTDLQASGISTYRLNCETTALQSGAFDGNGFALTTVVVRPHFTPAKNNPQALRRSLCSGSKKCTRSVDNGGGSRSGVAMSGGSGATKAPRPQELVADVCPLSSTAGEKEAEQPHTMAVKGEERGRISHR